MTISKQNHTNVFQNIVIVYGEKFSILKKAPI